MAMAAAFIACLAATGKPRLAPRRAPWHYHPIESGLQDFRRPLTLSLSPSDGERVAFRPGEGNMCVTSAWWWCRVAPCAADTSFSPRSTVIEITIMTVYDSTLDCSAHFFDSRCFNAAS